MANRLECIDAGSDYCPCYLAELNECITCSLLQGKDFCDCNLRGVCVYQEYVWSGFKAKSKRETILSKVMERKKIKDNLLILTLKVPQKMARELKEPGSFVFLRGCSSHSFFDVPIAIMHVDEIGGSVKVAIKIRGPKTKLLEKCSDEVYLRGPYWNGLFGQRYIKGIHHSRCFIVLGGVARASGVLVIDKLIKKKNDVTLLLDKADVIFVKEYLSKGPKIHEEDIFSGRGQKLLKELVSDKSISFIYSGGRDEQHRNILEFVRRYNPEAYLAVSNNNTLCCGEGVCGSCEVDINGEKARACKVQFDVREKWLK